MRKVLNVLGLAVAFGLIAGCATRAGIPETAASPSPPTADNSARVVVPQLSAMRAAEADGILTKAGLVPILRYEPGIVAGKGTVVNTDPPVGSLLKAGDMVTVIVAGSPGTTLRDHIEAHRELFVGIGVDANGVLVVGVHQSADLAKQMPELSKLANGQPLRVKTCSRSWADLMRVQLELARRDFLPGADKLAFATTVDPLACAVRLTIDLTDAQVAEVTAKYEGALVIQKGTATRGG